MTTWLKPVQQLLKQNRWSGAKSYLTKYGLVLLPAIIDSHVHFRTPGQEYKENWASASAAMAGGGVAGVIDMPNNQPAITDSATLRQKIKLIKRQLKFPIKYFFYLGASAEKLPKRSALSQVVGLKVYQGSTTGSLLVDNPKYLKKIFQSWPGLLSFHAEAENLIKQRTEKYRHLTSANKHSLIRNYEVATRAVRQVIGLAKKYHRTVYICHVSTKQEIDLIKKAKKAGLKIFAEVSPHHLFLNQSVYKKLGNLAKVNPPLRTEADNQALWQAIKDGTIDVIATDHAPHLLKEKRLSYEKAPAGLPEIDTFLPLMLNAVNQEKLSLNRLLELVHYNPIKIFKLNGLEKSGAIVDLNLIKKSPKKKFKNQMRLVAL